MPWVEFSFPEAPSKSNWFGAELPILRAQVEDAERLEEAVANVHRELSQLESRGIVASRVILGGYGPGGALALLAGVCSVGTRTQPVGT